MSNANQNSLVHYFAKWALQIPCFMQFSTKKKSKTNVYLTKWNWNSLSAEWWQPAIKNSQALQKAVENVKEKYFKILWRKENVHDSFMFVRIEKQK